MNETRPKSAWSLVSWLWEKSKWNLVILIWLGLACQAAGVIGFLSDLVRSEASIGPALFMIFGLAVGGWAGNLKEITELKARLAQLEGCVPESSSNTADG